MEDWAADKSELSIELAPLVEEEPLPSNPVLKMDPDDGMQSLLLLLPH